MTAALVATVAAGTSAALAAAPLRRPMPGASSAGGRSLSRFAPRARRWLPAVMVLLVLPLGGVVAGVLAAAGAAMWPRLRRRRAAARAEEQRARAVTELLRGFALELGAGLGPAAALRAAVPTSAAGLLEDLARVEGGGDVADVLVGCADPGLRELGAAWTVSHATGAPLAALADRLAQVGEGLEAGRAEVRAALAAPRASGRLLASLPLGGIALAAMLGGAPVHFLLHTPAGGACLVLGTALDLAGLAWLERLARRVQP